jgi:hypothetical protein
MEAIRKTLQTIQLIRAANMENSNLDDVTKERLQNPPTGEVHNDDPQMYCALDLFLNTLEMKDANYTKATACVNKMTNEHFAPLPSIHELKNHISELTGITPVRDDTCINTCKAFTGIRANDTHCDT